ncbi:glycoside hydrolase family 10 protein [Kitasatospora sp. NPDC098652]|uniref:glycoside hydrolase family 10 protein n=1 Tax=Kitasatospora sp. NPDC098652 TaxID=3364095 RepID=UPI0037F46A65
MGRITRRGFVAGTAAALGGLAVAAPASAPASAAGRGGPQEQPGRVAAERRDGEREFRGVWLTTVANRDWPSRPGLTAEAQRAELLARLDQALERRLNAVLLHVRPTADALWPSPYEPWSAWLTGVQGQDPGWDPLGTAVEEAHQRGLELHAWCNPYRIATHDDPSRLVPTHPARLHPDWVVAHGGRLHYNPGLPEVRRFVQDAMLDAVRRYDVDGVHFDDYFYPYPVAGQRFDDDAAYARYGADFPDRDAWRRDNIDLLVREMGARIKAVNSRVRFGISPFGVWRNQATDQQGSATTAGVQAYDDLHADTRKWVREGWIDYICPQLYWNIGFAAADYAVLVPWWDAVARGTGVDLYLGEALYKAGAPGQPAAWQDPAELSRHLTLAQDYGTVRGHCFFAAREVAEDRIGAMARVVADHYRPD